MKSTRWRLAGIILLLLMLLLIASSLILPRLIDLNRYKGSIVSQLESALGGEIALGDLDWGIADGIWVQAEGLSVKGATAFPGDLSLFRLHAEISILHLLSKEVRVEEILLDGLAVTIRLLPSEPKQEEVDDERAGEQPAATNITEPTPLPVEISVEELIVRDGRLRLEDSLTLPGRQIVQEFTEVSIQGTDLELGKELSARVSSRIAADRDAAFLSGQAWFSGLTESFTIMRPRMKVQATLADLDVERISPYLGSEEMSKQLGGTISLEVDYEGDLGDYHSMAGSIDLSRLEYSDPSMWETPIPGMQTTLNYRVSVNPEELRIEELKVELGSILMTAQAGLRDWSGEPVIQDAVFSAEIPLAEAVPLVPWKEVGEIEYSLRKSLQEGGKIFVQDAVIPELPLKKIPERWRELLERGKGSIEVKDISVKVSPLLPGTEIMSGKFSLEGGVLRATETTARVGPLTLPVINLSVTDLAGKPKLSAEAEGLLRLVGDANPRMKELLKEHGLKRITGDIETDMIANYDHARPRDWDVRANLTLKGVSAEFLVEDVSFKDLRGNVTLRRGKSLEAAIEDLQGRMNGSPIRLDGKLLGVGTERFVLDAKARTKALDLSLARVLYSPIGNLNLGGTLDLNLHVHYPNADPPATRLKGSVKVGDVSFRLDAQSMKVEDLDADVVLSGETADIKSLTLRANDQKLSLSGRVSDVRSPRAHIRITSAGLDLDRLLPAAGESEVSRKPVAQGEIVPVDRSSARGQGEGTELPPLLRKLTAGIEADVKHGQYRKQPFKNLRVKAAYEKGVLKSHSLKVDMAEGHLGTDGSADFRNPGKISFDLEPSLRSVPLEAVAAMAGMKEETIKGPLTLSGRMQGETGSVEHLLDSLQGSLEGRMGPGRIFRIGPVGQIFFKMFELLNVSTLLERRGELGLGKEGIAYDSIDLKTSLEGGNLELHALDFKSPAMNMECTGKLDLQKDTIGLDASVGVLGTVDKALGFIPIAGGVGASVTKVYLKIHGPLEDPRIDVLPGKGVRKAVKGAVAAPGEAGRGVLKGVGQVFRKPNDPKQSEDPAPE